MVLGCDLHPFLRKGLLFCPSCKGLLGALYPFIQIPKCILDKKDLKSLGFELRVLEKEERMFP